MRTMNPRWLRLLGWILVLLPIVALARVGGGEHYSGPSSSSDRVGDGDDGAFIVWLLIRLAIEHPTIGVPLLIVVGIGYFWVQHNRDPGTRTHRAIQQAEAARRTQVSPSHVTGWVNTLKHKDPDFDLLAFTARVRQHFIDVQNAWFQRNLNRVRSLLSDATFQRLQTQLDLLQRQGIRDAITDLRILEVGLIGLEQSEWFDTLHVRIRAQMRDTDVPANTSDRDAVEAARRAPPETFTEVWSFVRKPGTRTKPGQDASQGKCPNCGAPFSGGATNTCEYCNAVVNSGNYDWTLSEITQGVEHVGAWGRVDGLREARQADPALNLEMLEDRASLLFWRWITAQSHAEPRELAKLATPDFVASLGNDLEAYRAQDRRKIFLECAVGGVHVHTLRTNVDGFDEAHVEIRWSARMGVVQGPRKPARFPTIPQRWVFILVRKAGATTRTENGLATSRCPNCNAPLSDTLSTTCDFCSAELATGEREWVLRDALVWEAWTARDQRRYAAAVADGRNRRKGSDRVLDPEERERVLYTMAAVAAADGVVDPRERELLKMCANRWKVPWSDVEAALQQGPDLAAHEIPKGSEHAELLLRALVQMALVDGRVDRREKKLLESAAAHLGVTDRLEPMLRA